MTDQVTKAPLDQRIASAFAQGTTSGAVHRLIVEAKEAAASAEQTAQTARSRALDPKLSEADVAAARKEMDDAAFRRERMQTAVTGLKERFEELTDQEEDRRRWILYKAAKAERDRLAAELTELYPLAAAKLAGLAARIVANDRELQRVNTAGRPKRSEALLSAEAVARGLQGFVDGSADIPRITTRLQLPAFRYSSNSAYAWPANKA